MDRVSISTVLHLSKPAQQPRRDVGFDNPAFGEDDGVRPVDGYDRVSKRPLSGLLTRREENVTIVVIREGWTPARLASFGPSQSGEWVLAHVGSQSVPAVDAP
jgi:hypothetical protein